MNDDIACICGRLRRASRTLSRRYDAALAAIGMNVNQYAVLRNLSQMPRPTLAEFAERTAHEKSAMWRTLQPMIRDGWITVEPGRTQHFSLSDAGRAQLDLARPFWTEAQAEISNILGQREAVLIELLHEIETHV